MWESYQKEISEANKAFKKSINPNNQSRNPKGRIKGRSKRL